jgi:hypothetical protein
MEAKEILGPSNLAAEGIRKQARKDAKTGNYRASLYQGLARIIYIRAYLGAREKMGLLGKTGPGKEI